MEEERKEEELEQEEEEEEEAPPTVTEVGSISLKFCLSPLSVNGQIRKLIKCLKFFALGTHGIRYSVGTVKWGNIVTFFIFNEFFLQKT